MVRWILWGSHCRLPMQVDQIGSRLLNPGVLHQRFCPMYPTPLKHHAGAAVRSEAIVVFVRRHLPGWHGMLIGYFECHKLPVSGAWVSRGFTNLAK